MMHGGSAKPRTIDLGLQRITALLERLSSPQLRFPVIHVAGTNSKGSTIAYLASILHRCVGISTASFTSPHLLIERDCCKVDEQVIDQATWDEAGKRVRQADDGAVEPAVPLNSTPFELLTARCFVAFDLLPPSRRPELLLVEVGMGGTQDATNVFSPQQVLASVICPIDYDHQAFLGGKLREIASQKAGIVQKGGLCVMADQRKPPQQQASGTAGDDQVDCTRLKAGQSEALIDGKEAGEIQEAVREKCASMQARVVKAYVPWQALSASGDVVAAQSSSPWSMHIRTSVRYTPVLLPSKLHQGDYVSSAGDPVVQGPTLLLPRTRAALTGCHLALQTLWSIARDETPCALGAPGSDGNEELRLRIAYGIRNDRMGWRGLEACVAETFIKGRAEWVDIPLQTGGPAAESNEGGLPDAMQIDGGAAQQVVEEAQLPTPSPSLPLHALVDGAHNVSAAVALCEYVGECIRQRVRSSRQQSQSSAPISKVTVTWIVAFSKGKAIADIVAALLGDAGEDMSGLASQLASTQLDTHIEHRVACLPFTTPVEGMPWVTSERADEVAAAFTSHSKAISDVETFDHLHEALQWAAIAGDGSAVSEDGSASMVVIAGSLYLVSDVHRLLSPSTS